MTSEISEEETTYLCAAVNRYLRRQISADDVIWSFSGVRPLLDDGHDDPSSVTRDYTLDMDDPGDGAVMLSVFGGKITTYRKLAEAALSRLASHLPEMGPAWTETARLPGGDMNVGGHAKLVARLTSQYSQLSTEYLDHLAARHGTNTSRVLGDAQTDSDLGQDFGAGLRAREVAYLIADEWAACADDIMWRRTKAGLGMNAKGRRSLQDYIDQRTRHAA